MRRLYRAHQRGDTIVEVLLATVVLSVILAGAYAISNRSTRFNQASLERTEVANQLAEQVELLRAARSNGGPAWTGLVDGTLDSPGSGPDYSSCQPSGANAFFVDATYTAQLFDTGDTTQLGTDETDNYPTDLFEIWIEAYNPTGEYIDVHARGCWNGPGDTGGQRSVVFLRMAL